MTLHQAKYYAHYLTLQTPSNGLERVMRSVINATIDLNPHQIEAALFFFKNPLGQGVMLADEVGLGKTIEAGLVMCQLRSEHKRRILLIAPAALRKQWLNELHDKFQLPSIILDSTIYNSIQKLDKKNPFIHTGIVICSYDFAARHADDIEDVHRDVVVMDEAHKLRNVYKDLEKEADIFADKPSLASDLLSTNWKTVSLGDDDHISLEKRISRAKRLKDALYRSKKLLLTATPLQNDLLELYGLTSFLDDYLFGDIVSFKEQYCNQKTNVALLQDLKKRLSSVVHRTLRKHVSAYIKYTQRRAYTQQYKRSKEESQYHEAITDFMMSNELFKTRNGQPNYFVLFIYWKILASSFYAITGTLTWLLYKIQWKIDHLVQSWMVEKHKVLVWEIIYPNTLPENIEEDQDILALCQEEFDGDEAEWEDVMYSGIWAMQAKALQDTYEQVKSIIALGKSMQSDSKRESLLAALSKAFEIIEETKNDDGKKANRKVLIFTESRRTQEYLYQYLIHHGYDKKILCFNGSNDSKETSEIYKNRKTDPQNTSKVTGSKTSDIRNALVDYFRDHADIMIATESAAEWLNLQFCSLLINYDLPWNPQRVEQRIGRCHRYGQLHDVTVINLINTDNRADERVYELLSEKLNLFNGMFGSSDEILGQLESWLDIERKILEIFQTCRTKEQIDTAFDDLQQQMELIIEDKMKTTKQTVLDEFDEQVAARLQDRKDQATLVIDHTKRFLWYCAKFALQWYADFDEDNLSFVIHTPPQGDIELGKYVFMDDAQKKWSHILRTNSPLWNYIIAYCKNQDLSSNELLFDLSHHRSKLSLLEQYKWLTWYLSVDLLRIVWGEYLEEHLIVSCIDAQGNQLDPQIGEDMLKVQASNNNADTITPTLQDSLDTYSKQRQSDIQAISQEYTNNYFWDEIHKLDKWADDIRITLERKVKTLQKEISQMKSEAIRQKDILSRAKLEKEILTKESKFKELRRKLYDEEDSLENKKRKLVSDLLAKTQTKVEVQRMFMIGWKII
jgi:ERCC4-related helicase